MVPQKLLESSYLARYLLLNAVDITDYKTFLSVQSRILPLCSNSQIPKGRMLFCPSATR